MVTSATGNSHCFSFDPMQSRQLLDSEVFDWVSNGPSETNSNLVLQLSGLLMALLSCLLMAMLYCLLLVMLCCKPSGTHSHGCGAVDHHVIHVTTSGNVADDEHDHKYELVVLKLLIRRLCLPAVHFVPGPVLVVFSLSLEQQSRAKCPFLLCVLDDSSQLAVVAPKLL